MLLRQQHTGSQVALGHGTIWTLVLPPAMALLTPTITTLSPITEVVVHQRVDLSDAVYI